MSVELRPDFGMLPSPGPPAAPAIHVIDDSLVICSRLCCSAGLELPMEQ